MECQAHGTPLDQLQFLDRADFQRYILTLVDQSGHLTGNTDYLPAFHHQHLTKHKSDSKKDSGYVETYDLGLSDFSLTRFLALNTESYVIWFLTQSPVIYTKSEPASSSL